MSKPGNTRRFGYITGETAVDINRMTGIPLSYHKGRPSTHYEAVDQGVVPLDEVYYDLDRMEPWDRFGLGWSLLAGHAVLAGIAALEAEIKAFGEVDNNTRADYNLPPPGTWHLDPEYHQPQYNLDG